MSNPQEDRPVAVPSAPSEEDIDLTDADEQLEQSPEEKSNLTEDESRRDDAQYDS